MVGFAVASLDRALAALRGVGARILTEPKEAGSRRAVAEDPDARAVEITQVGEE